MRQCIYNLYRVNVTHQKWFLKLDRTGWSNRVNQESATIPVFKTQASLFCCEPLELWSNLQVFKIRHNLSSWIRLFSSLKLFTKNERLRSIFLERDWETREREGQKSVSLKITWGCGFCWSIYRTTYKGPLGMSHYHLVYGKPCHFPIELEYKAYWAIKAFNFDL